MKSIYLGLLFINLFFVSPIDAEIVIKDAFAVTSTPHSKSGAIFMMIHNHSNNVDRLLSAKTPFSKITELHSSEMENDIMKMVRVLEGFEVPSHGHLALKHGGKHVMMMGLQRKLEQNSKFQLFLEFENAGQIEVQVVFRGSGGNKKMDHSHDH